MITIRPYRRLLLGIVVVAAFGVIGIIMILQSKAAGPFVALQPETGTKTAPAATVNDANASGGQAVQFGSTVTPPPPPPPVATLKAVCGTWALRQVDTYASLSTAGYQNEVNKALAFSNVAGYSVRVPWKEYVLHPDMFVKAKEIVKPGQSYAIRTMAGRHTPASAMTDPAYFTKIKDPPGNQTAGVGESIPLPFNQETGAAGNPQFEAAYRQMVQNMATYARANGIRIIHLPWHGYLWAEIYVADDVTKLPKYTDAAWLQGHKNLIDIASEVAGDDLAVEFPLSGHMRTDFNGDGDTADAGENKGALVNQLVTYMQTKFNSTTANVSNRIFVQGNGLNDGDPAKEGGLLTPTQGPINYGMQMHQPGSYNWQATYDHIIGNKTRYVEVYTPSFGLTGSAELQTQISRFKQAKCDIL